MAEPAVDTGSFDRLFASPSIESMLDLSWSDFEDFVQYVFECAGYAVRKVSSHPRKHVDLILYSSRAGAKPVARVEVRRYATAHIIKGAVLKFIGALHVSGQTPGFLVTTSDFTKPAYEAADASHGRATLINGQRLLRYIRYVYGTHLVAEDTAASRLPQSIISPDSIVEAEKVPCLDARQTTVLSMVNNKGGVGKTTTALNLAFALAGKRQHRVLLIDLDGQASLTHALLDGEHLQTSLLDHFTNGQPLGSLVQATRFERIWLIPADDRLFRLDLGAEHRQAAELGFARAIHDRRLLTPQGEQFDWILLDTPPAQSFFTRLALGASHYVLLTATAETQAVFGANRALTTAKTMRALMPDRSEVVGGVVTRWRKSERAEQSVVGLVDILRKSGTRLFATRITEDADVERAHEQIFAGKRRTLFDLHRHPGRAAESYEALMKELLTHVKRS